MESLPNEHPANKGPVNNLYIIGPIVLVVVILKVLLIWWLINRYRQRKLNEQKQHPGRPSDNWHRSARAANYGSPEYAPPTGPPPAYRPGSQYGDLGKVDKLDDESIKSKSRLSKDSMV